MDGYDATLAIRAAEQGTPRHVPIVALTAHAMKGDREERDGGGSQDPRPHPRSEEHTISTPAIRAAEQGTPRHVPIVALTAHAMKGDREERDGGGSQDPRPHP